MRWTNASEHKRQETGPLDLHFVSNGRRQEAGGEPTKALKRRGITCWVDREMAKGKNWREEIVNGIHRCDVFLPVMTREFNCSEWSGQECGIAYAKGKLMCPVSFNNTRLGFVETLSAINVRRNTSPQMIASRVVGALVDHSE